MIEDRHGERALGAFLTNHIAVEKLVKLTRSRNLFRKDFRLCGFTLSVFALSLLRILARHFNLQFRSHCERAQNTATHRGRRRSSSVLPLFNFPDGSPFSAKRAAVVFRPLKFGRRRQ